MDYDVAIIGGGAAGIAACRKLLSARRSVVLLEASDRLGGRAWTTHLAGMPLDLGCGWLHSADRNPLVQIGEAAGFTIVRGSTAWRRQWHDIGFRREDRKAAEAAWAALKARLRSDPPSSDRAADALPLGGEWNGFCEAISGYLNGASLGSLSIADFLAYEDAASDSNWRVLEGYGSLISASQPAAAMHFSCPVRRVAMTPGGTDIDTDRGRFSARTAIVTASTNVIAEGVIAFDREVDGHVEAASHLPLGIADKLFIELHGRHGLKPETHLLGNPRDANTGSYYVQPLGRPVVEGFFGGPGAKHIEEAGLLAAFDLAVEQLAALLGNHIRRHLRPLAASSWCRTDWVRGSYSHALPGRASARAVLSQPVADRLFFAGEATHPTDFSTAHGAWESGLRAADQVCRALESSGS